MSGAPGLNFNTKSDLVAKNTADVAQEAGCIRDGDSQSAETLKFLKEAPFELLTNLSITAARAARPPFGGGFFFPIFDGDLIEDAPSEQLRAGKIAQGIPILAEWSTNDGGWYASPTTSTDQDALSSFGLWLSGLSDITNSKLLDLYPEGDFAFMVDIWFTCPVVDFARQYLKHGGVRASQVHVAAHNSSRFTPIYAAMGVPQWRVAHLSDIPYVLDSQSVAAGGDNSAPQLDLSRGISRSIASFVTSGIPDGMPGLETWPPAFDGASAWELEQGRPSRLTLEVKGGPFGNTVATIGNTTNAASETGAQAALNRERLYGRCSFINSKSFREEAGV
ncbi:uncharacterized protein JN550_007793 [Neoarthrinium moseri]|uniref:uncharacterized protein n=1 Tax=Neoarthrinium moseri TaxID=1658444 RepID=UPI001FDB63DE|nr:uncharacterized protein JN550_007793 [Neoarthrinium moseri]KAI1866104.1 hypothetical protein JN550_007793 [Neoarthrinium moseri]